MYRRNTKDWMKHLDFIILDLLALQVSFVLSFVLRHGMYNPYRIPMYANMGMFLMLCDLVLILFTDTFRNVLKRGYYREFASVVQHTLLLVLLAVLFLFSQKVGSEYSRISMFLLGILYTFINYVFRLFLKLFIRKKRREGSRSLLIVTVHSRAEQIIRNFRERNYGTYRFAGLALMDEACVGKEIEGVPVVADAATASDYAQKTWVDEVFVSLPQTVELPREFMDRFAEMGVTVHRDLAEMVNMSGRTQLVEKVGGYTVLTSTMKCATTRQAFFKRMIDILGGIVGCLITAVLFLFVAPAIYINSPGPIFFSQVRIGKNGKRFKMYKFRSMYMDAEERKKELMAENKIEGGLMFKLDFDPRIIGNRILPDGTHKTGVGQFIRSTSIDEFPQFLNVLMGDMSLVGTRPPTVDEFEQYEPHHRARMSVKPGITGMWQVSGRSEITDFEEVVRLDTQYINEWSMGLDFRILFKTVAAVLKRRGSV